MLDDKIRRFQDAVLQDANAKKQEILSSIDQHKTHEISSSEDSALSSAYELIKGEVSELSVESTREISQKRLAQKKEYLTKRGQLEQSVFTSVRKRLLDYTATDAYKERLLADIKTLGGEIKSETATLFLNERDKSLEDAVKKAFGKKCELVFSAKPAIGGIIVEDSSEGYISDLSLDTALNDQKDWFYTNCKL